MKTEQISINDIKISGKVKLTRHWHCKKTQNIGTITLDDHYNLISGAEHIVAALEIGLQTVNVQIAPKNISLKNKSMYGTHKILSKTKFK